MKCFSKAAVGGLLWLSFSVAFGSTTLTITGQPNPVDTGGQFSAYLGPTDVQNLLIYCVDYANEIGVPSTTNVNLTDLADMPVYTNDTNNDTRYGETAPGSFSYAVAVYLTSSSTTAATAQDRYAMAAWLTQQYIFPVGTATSAQITEDDQIQNAIWSLLNTAGTSGFPGGDSAGVGNYINQAQSWIDGQIQFGTLSTFENEVTIYSNTNIASMTGAARYSTPTQEMIGVVPEPAPLALLGIGLVAIGLLRKRAKV